MSLINWVGTPLEIVRKMLELAKVGPKDVLYDLGSGDARVLIAAVKEFGVKEAVGYEIRDDLCKIAQQQIKQRNLQQRIRVIKGNLLEADLCMATVITIYLSREANEILRPKLERYASPRSRIISYLFPITGWQVFKKLELKDYHFGEARFVGALYLYLIPQAFMK